MQPFKLVARPKVELPEWLPLPVKDWAESEHLRFDERSARMLSAFLSEQMKPVWAELSTRATDLQIAQFVCYISGVFPDDFFVPISRRLTQKQERQHLEKISAVTGELCRLLDQPVGVMRSDQWALFGRGKWLKGLKSDLRKLQAKCEKYKPAIAPSPSYFLGDVYQDAANIRKRRTKTWWKIFAVRLVAGYFWKELQTPLYSAVAATVNALFECDDIDEDLVRKNTADIRAKYKKIFADGAHEALLRKEREETELRFRKIREKKSRNLPRKKQA